MRSGNGRHRRPRQAPAVVVAAGVTGAGIALPLLGATGAHAADAADWDRVAECASNGVWSAGDAHPYYGGLQLSLDSWQLYGGTAYAPRPDLASRSQQIAVAEKILKAEGPAAFPHCGDGLTTDHAPEVNPGDDLPSDSTGSGEHSPERTAPGKGTSHGGTTGDDGERPPSGEHGSSGERGEADRNDGDTGHKKTDGKEKSDGKGKSDGSDKADGSHSAPSDGPAHDGHKGGSAPTDPSARPDDGTDDTDDSAPSDSWGWTSQGPSSPERLKASSGGGGGLEAPGTGKHRGKPAEEEDGRHDRSGRPSRGDARERLHEGGGRHRVTVQPGDSLSGIAADLDVPGGWRELYDGNRGVIGDDPDLIRPGQHLRV